MIQLAYGPNEGGIYQNEERNWHDDKEGREWWAMYQDSEIGEHHQETAYAATPAVKYPGSSLSLNLYSHARKWHWDLLLKDFFTMKNTQF